MFKCSLLILLLYATTLASGTDSPQVDSAQTTSSPDSLRVISWNIEWYPGQRRNPTPEEAQHHAERVKPIVARLNPDLLLAQEIANWQAFAELCDAVPDLRPAVVSAFHSEQTGEYWDQQLAIASKLPVLAAWSEPWSEGEIHPRRGFSAAAIQLPDSDQLLLVYNVHLKSNRSSSDEETALNYQTREESVRQLIAHVDHMRSTVFPGRIAGVIIGGDFNTNHDGQFGDRTIAMLIEAGYHQTWQDTPRDKRLTWRGNPRFEPTTFDYFFTKDLPQVRATLLETGEVSDHWPLLIEIPLPLDY